MDVTGRPFICIIHCQRRSLKIRFRHLNAQSVLKTPLAERLLPKPSHSVVILTLRIIFLGIPIGWILAFSPLRHSINVIFLIIFGHRNVFFIIFFFYFSMILFIHIWFLQLKSHIGLLHLIFINIIHESYLLACKVRWGLFLKTLNLLLLRLLL